MKRPVLPNKGLDLGLTFVANIVYLLAVVLPLPVVFRVLGCLLFVGVVVYRTVISLRQKCYGYAALMIFAGVAMVVIAILYVHFAAQYRT